MTIRVTVWGENVHEQKNKVVAEVYPEDLHGTIAEVPEQGSRDRGHDGHVAGPRAWDDRKPSSRRPTC